MPYETQEIPTSKKAFYQMKSRLMILQTTFQSLQTLMRIYQSMPQYIGRPLLRSLPFWADARLTPVLA